MAFASILSGAVALTLLVRYITNSQVHHPLQLVLLAFTITTVVYSTWHLCLYPYYFSPFRHLPSPNQSPLRKRLLKEPMADTTERYLNEVPNNGIIRYFGILNQERLMVASPELTKHVMQTQGYNFVKTGLAAKVLRKIIPYGLLTCNDAEEHKFQRKVLNKAFKFSNIRQLFPLLWTQSLCLLSALDQELSSGSFDEKSLQLKQTVNIWTWMTRATLDAIVLATFGGRWNAVANPHSSLAKSWDVILGSDRASALYRASALILPGWLWERLPVKARYRYDAAKEEVKRETLKLIKVRMSQAKRNDKAGPDDVKIDIMSEILRSAHPKSEDELLGQALTFLAAGHDTTANGLTFVLYLLSTHPEIQSKARAEIHAKIPSPSPVTAAAAPTNFDPTTLESLIYTQAIISEGLRLYAPIPHQRRVVKHANTTLGGLALPLGTTVVVNPYSLNRSRAIWGGDEATRFKPERWIDPAGAAAATGHQHIDTTGGTGNVFAVATFGHGPRQCIGEKFAKVEMLAILTALIGRYEWTFHGAGEKGDEELQVVFPIVTKPVGGLWLSYQRNADGW